MLKNNDDYIRDDKKRMMEKIISVHVRESKSALDFGLRILCQWNLDSGFQIPWIVYRIAKPRIPNLTAKICCITDSTSRNFPDSGTGFPLHLGRIIDTVQSINGIVITHLLCTFCSSCHRERKELCPEIPLRSQHLDHVWLSFPQFFQADLNGS